MNLKIKNKEHKIPLFSTNFNIMIVIICTIVIVSSNYYISKKTTLEINDIIQQYEYNKTGGEDNYKIMMEIQKDQMNKYIKDLTENNPEYLEKIINKINFNEVKEEKILSNDEIKVLNTTSSILGNEKLDYSIIEFSDFECKYCKEFHNENNIGELLKENNNWNYIYKNMIHKNNTASILASKYGKCIENKGGKDMYFDFVSEMFKNNDINSINKFIENNNLNLEEIKNCTDSEKTTISLEKEFGQGVYLGVNSTPSIVLINNSTGNFVKIEGKLTQDELSSKMKLLEK